MVARLATNALFVLAVLVPAAPGRSEEKERDFESVFLYDGGDGYIWLGLPVVHLGMAGVMEMPPSV